MSELLDRINSGRVEPMIRRIAVSFEFQERDRKPGLLRVSSHHYVLDEVLMDQAARELLISLGWTPPAGETA